MHKLACNPLRSWPKHTEFSVFFSYIPQDYFEALHFDWKLVNLHLNGLRIGKLRQKTLADNDIKVSFFQVLSFSDT
jgi:hypothetical protein